jgi:hypothetical protein
LQQLNGTFYFVLQNFISEIRAASNKEQEKARVDKELGKIRKKFSGGNLTGVETPCFVV